MLIKRSVFDEVGLFQPGLVHGEDNDMWFRIAFSYPQVGYVNQPLALYYEGVPGSITTIQRSLDITAEQIQHLLKLAEENVLSLEDPLSIQTYTL